MDRSGLQLLRPAVGTRRGTVAAGDDERFRSLWSPPTSDVITYPSLTGALTAQAQTSGRIYLIGDRDLVVPAGRPVGAASFQSFGKSTKPTSQFFVIAIPDEAGADIATIVAVSKDDGETAWGEGVIKKLSFKEADGGTGIWTPEVDTPVLIGVCQVAEITATMRGLALGNSAYSDLQKPRRYAFGPSELKSPANLVGGVITLNASSVALVACNLTESTS